MHTLEIRVWVHIVSFLVKPKLNTPYIETAVFTDREEADQLFWDLIKANTGKDREEFEGSYGLAEWKSETVGMPVTYSTHQIVQEVTLTVETE